MKTVVAIAALCLTWALDAPAAASGKPPVRVMPLGDSITQGAAGHHSYRRFLWRQLRQSGFTVDFVGSLKRHFPNSKPPRTDFDMDHEGHWGWRTDEILARLDGWAADALPDIVLIHLGTNDIFQGQSDAGTIAELGQVIHLLRRHNPRVCLLVAEIIPVAGEAGRKRVARFNALLPDLAARMTTAASPVRLVDHQSGFDPAEDTYDGVHPNTAGSVKMARRWHDAMIDCLERHQGGE
jgi:acyl-CoA thioesterase-1